MKKLKIIFAGTSHFSMKYLDELIKSEHKVVAVFTQPDRPSGRGQKIIFSPVKILSIKKNIPFLQPLELNNEEIQNKILTFNPDIMVVVSYGKLIPKKILTMFPNGCINVHTSLLPRWRGASPIQSAILFGDKETGISIIKMNEKMDAGPIINSVKCSISCKDTTETLTFKLIKIGIKALLETLYYIKKNTIFEKEQNEKYATFSKKISKKDALLNWNTKAYLLERSIRAFNPWPICYFIVNKTRIKVWKAKIIPNVKKGISIGEIVSFNKCGIQINTAHQILNLQKIQFPGKKIINVEKIVFSKKDWFNTGKII
ncbi:methionyl-tRNA formyltransferase [Buchnera aphidicola]|uniref:Methionyl-tRNA formyltransferase n=1 Tax=Buchnera aphidicola subsp. Rhopalosiphum maidis TaxID=118109 RepID=A0A3G2I670_BUCRM|nr:methionyl-tRNA formyltransferase [Buchnera aphidicola]AYN24593.1 methionyl-tRNA formyltransferase [Buchnera aphidicola (Rhopalosiphum maidis)]